MSGWGAFAQAAADLVGMGVQQWGGDGGMSDRLNANFQHQKEMAQHGIRWRVEDAKAAGIHPLFALGAQIPAGQPVTVFSEDNDEGIARSLSSFGQNIGRAIDSTRTDGERTESRLQALQVERAELENEMLRSQISRMQANQVGPPMVNPGDPGVRTFGTSDASQILEKPLERVSGAPGAPYQEAGAVTDLGFTRTKTGWAVVPSKDWKDRGEDQLVPEVTWAIRNHLLPTISPSRYGMPPPETWLPEGASRWRFDRVKQEWQPVFTAEGQSRVRYRID